MRFSPQCISGKPVLHERVFQFHEETLERTAVSLALHGVRYCDAVARWTSARRLNATTADLALRALPVHVENLVLSASEIETELYTSPQSSSSS